MKINGMVTELRIVELTRPRGKKFQGQEFRERFRAGKLMVTVDYMVARPSAVLRDTAKCSAVIVVKKGSTIQPLRARGTRGC